MLIPSSFTDTLKLPEWSSRLTPLRHVNRIGYHIMQDSSREYPESAQEFYDQLADAYHLIY